jgi:hypothetical protein
MLIFVADQQINFEHMTRLKFWPVVCLALFVGCQAPVPSEQTQGLERALAAGVQPCKLTAPPAPRYLPKPVGTAWFAPSPPAYPYPQDAAAIVEQAQCISNALESYIKAWLDGKVPAQIPDAFVPQGIDRQLIRGFSLVKPEAITAGQQWGVRPAGPVDFEKLKHSFPDPNVTYLLLLGMIVPFGHQVIVEGEFPHARFFDLQVTPSLDPRSYRYDGGIGVGEVPIVDADIEPLPGHTNPFRVGADRNAVKRGFRVSFRMAVGDPVKLNAAFRPPYFRERSNERVGGGIMFQGPWGAQKGYGHGRGIWGAGEIWGRYYLPDKSRGPLAGVPLPRVKYQLPDGRTYFIKADVAEFIAMANRTFKLDPQPPVDPATKPETLGARGQWVKQTGIFRALLTGIHQNTDWGSAEYVRMLDKGVAGRGADLVPPNNYEQSATSATYVDYLGRGMALSKGQVAVLTGKLPTFPLTYEGEPSMRAAQMRYWSIVGYEIPQGWDFAKAMMGAQVRPGGLAVHEVFDEEMVLDAQRRYVIVLSRPEDRPRNAGVRDGVTWVNWGPAGSVAWTLRWLTVGPEWTGPMAPTPQNLGWRVDKVESSYDPRVLPNNHQGALGEYLPRAHYLSKEQFEKLGAPVMMDKVPAWVK